MHEEAKGLLQETVAFSSPSHNSCLLVIPGEVRPTNFKSDSVGRLGIRSEVGDVVIVCDKSAPRSVWAVAWVSCKAEGRDGGIRRVGEEVLIDGRGKKRIRLIL